MPSRISRLISAAKAMWYQFVNRSKMFQLGGKHGATICLRRISSVTESLPIFLYPDEQIPDRPANRAANTQIQSLTKICAHPRLSCPPSQPSPVFFSIRNFASIVLFKLSRTDSLHSFGRPGGAKPEYVFLLLVSWSIECSRSIILRALTRAFEMNHNFAKWLNGKAQKSHC